MSTSLAVRYHFGLTGWPSTFSPEGELVYGIPQLVALGERQLAAMRQLNVAEATVANEIAQQSRSLEEILRGIEAGSDQVSDAVDRLGDRVCADLCEIKWQLAQQGRVLERILQVLLQSRNNEAKQLVKQGVRHYVNGEFPEAEERFRLALSFDTTDYHVLMNLAFIQINKGDATDALKYFKKSLSLPENLDAACRARTLWAAARLHYAQRSFTEALQSAREAFQHSDRNDPIALYDLAVYLALAGDKQRALDLLEDAIHADVVYYGKAAVDPDLEGIRGEVLGLLARLAREAERKAKEAFAAVAKDFSSLPAGSGRVRFRELKGSTGQLLRQMQEGLKNPSYSACLRFPAAVEPLEEVVGGLGGLRELFSAEGTFASRSAECEDRQEKRRDFLARPLTWERRLSGTGWFVFVFVYIVSGCVFVISLAWGWIEGPSDFLGACCGIAVWPLLFLGLLAVSFGLLAAEYSDINVLGGWVGFIIAMLIQGLWFRAVIRAVRWVKKHYKDLSELTQLEQSAKAAKDRTESQVAALADLIRQRLLEAAQQWSSQVPVRP